MATNNIRVVGYLPPPYREKLREYMEAESLTESAALVKIVKRFFDTTTVPQVAEPVLGEEIFELKADIAQLQQRLTILEQAVASGRQFSKTKSRTSIQPKPQPSLPPQTIANLARRLGVSTSTIDGVCQKGDDAYFRDWSKRMDPMKRAWLHRGELFYPESE